MSGPPNRAGTEGGAGPRTILSPEERKTLRAVALTSIRHGLAEGRPLEPDSYPRDHPFSRPGAVFVTLHLNGELRGCVGSFEARRSLILDVTRNAYSAAFSDFRFPPVTEAEVDALEIHISLLSPLEPLPVANRADLLTAIRPGKDGLLLEDLTHRATFLPQVWESLPDPADFTRELFLKAGLSGDHWSDTVRFHRYSVEEF